MHSSNPRISSSSNKQKCGFLFWSFGTHLKPRGTENRGFGEDFGFQQIQQISTNYWAPALQHCSLGAPRVRVRRGTSSTVFCSSWISNMFFAVLDLLKRPTICWTAICWIICWTWQAPTGIRPGQSRYPTRCQTHCAPPVGREMRVIYLLHVP